MFITVHAVIPRPACNICYTLDYNAKSYHPSLLISKEKESSVIHLYYSVLVYCDQFTTYPVQETVTMGPWISQIMVWRKFPAYHYYQFVCEITKSRGENIFLKCCIFTIWSIRHDLNTHTTRILDPSSSCWYNLCRGFLFHHLKFIFSVCYIYFQFVCWMPLRNGEDDLKISSIFTVFIQYLRSLEVECHKIYILYSPSNTDNLDTYLLQDWLGQHILERSWKYFIADARQGEEQQIWINIYRSQAAEWNR